VAHHDRAREEGGGAAANAGARRAEQLRAGVALEPTILAALRPWAERWHASLPVAIDSVPMA